MPLSPWKLPLKVFDAIFVRATENNDDNQYPSSIILKTYNKKIKTEAVVLQQQHNNNI